MATSGKGRRTVLIIDDDEAVRLRITNILEAESYIEILSASTGEQGLLLAKENCPDLIFLDIVLPGIDGLEVCAQLRTHAQTQEVPIVMLSSAPESEFMLRAIEQGADDFLHKPIATNELRAKTLTITRLNRYRRLLSIRAREQWMVDTSEDAYVFIDLRGRVGFANRQAGNLFGIEAAEMVGMGLSEVLRDRYMVEPADALWRLANSKVSSGMLCMLCQPKSRHQPAQWFQVEAFTGDFSRDENILLKITDCTQQMTQVFQTWSFQEMISHKIRTPLSGLGGMLALIGESEAVNADPEAQKFLVMASQCAKRLQDTLVDILCYHEAMFEPAAVARTDTVGALLADLERCAGQEGLPSGRLDVQSGLDPSACYEGGRAANLAMMEVVSNYVKFSQAREHGLQVTLTVDSNQSLVLAFRAEGADFPDNLLRHLGEPFFQPEAIRTGEVPGMGLGLATARALLRSEGGDLRFHKDSVGGCLVTEMRLPCPFAGRQGSGPHRAGGSFP